MEENFNVFGFELTESEINLLNGLHDGRKFIDASEIKQKIDDQKPDGYKLDPNIQQILQNNRRKS